MWKDNEFYYALPKGKDSEVTANWEVVKHISQGHFKRVGNTFTYDATHFATISTLSMYNAVRLAKAFRTTHSKQKKNPTDSVDQILKLLNSLKDDFEGNISLTDADRDNTIQMIYRHLDTVNKASP
ncbi:hypothetical protein BN7874_066 [Phage NCTB]|nr:hypothetical protein BN7874_066 [Phage NCTB]